MGGAHIPSIVHDLFAFGQIFDQDKANVRVCEYPGDPMSNSSDQSGGARDGVALKSSSEKRRLPRFHITPCQYHDDALNKSFAVQDISTGGIGIRLVDKMDLPEFAVGMKRKGVIKVEGLKTECEIQVRYVKGSLVGTEWVKPSRELIEHLDQISTSEILGDHLKEYPLTEVPHTLWYHNPMGVDLLIYFRELPSAAVGEESSREFERWTLYIHQSFVQWDRDDEIQTGRTVAEDEEGYAHGLVQLETRMIDYDATPNQRLVDSARALLESAIDKGRITDDGVIKFIKNSLE